MGESGLWIGDPRVASGGAGVDAALEVAVGLGGVLQRVTAADLDFQRALGDEGRDRGAVGAGVGYAVDYADKH